MYVIISNIRVILISFNKECLFQASADLILFMKFGSLRNVRDTSHLINITFLLFNVILVLQRGLPNKFFLSIAIIRLHLLILFI